MSERPTVLFVHSNAELYGADLILLNTVLALRSDITPIVAVPNEGTLTQRLREVGVEVVVTRDSILRRAYFGPLRFPRFAFDVLRDTLALRRIVRQRRVALVYSNTAAVVTGALAAYTSSVAHLYHIHEIIEKPRWFARFIARFILGNADVVIGVSAAVKRQLDLFRRPGDASIRVIHNGIDTPLDASPAHRETIRAECGASPGHVLVGVIGRIHPWKGQSYFVDSIVPLARQYPDARFVIVGGTFAGYEHLITDLTRKIASLSLENVVRILPHRSDVPAVMSALDVFVLPSTSPDPLPTVVLEAMAAGKPVVATAHGGALEMVANELTGLTAAHDDAAAFARAIGRLICDAALRTSMGQAGRQRQQVHFSRPRYESELKALVGEMLAAKRNAR